MGFSIWPLLMEDGIVALPVPGTTSAGLTQSLGIGLCRGRGRDRPCMAALHVGPGTACLHTPTNMLLPSTSCFLRFFTPGSCCRDGELLRVPWEGAKVPGFAPAGSLAGMQWGWPVPQRNSPGHGDPARDVTHPVLLLPCAAPALPPAVQLGRGNGQPCLAAPLLASSPSTRGGFTRAWRELSAPCQGKNLCHGEALGRAFAGGLVGQAGPC